MVTQRSLDELFSVPVFSWLLGCVVQRSSADGRRLCQYGLIRHQEPLFSWAESFRVMSPTSCLSCSFSFFTLLYSSRLTEPLAFVPSQLYMVLSLMPYCLAASVTLSPSCFNLLIISSLISFAILNPCFAIVGFLMINI